MIYRLIGGLIIGVIYGLIYRLIGGLTYGLIIGLITGLIYGLVYILADWQRFPLERISLLETINFSFHNLRIELIDGIINGLLKGTKISLYSGSIVGSITIGLYSAFLGGTALISEGIFGLIFGVVVGLIIGGFYGAASGMTVFWISGLIFGVVGGGMFGLINVFSGREINIKKYPNQGVRESLKNAILLSTLFSLIIITIFILIQLILEILNLNQFRNFLYSLAEFAIIISTLLSILPVIQHLSLRIVLWSSGYAPWNYTHFLNYATNRLFLQRVGGGYRFIHRLLQEHFAKM